MVKMEQETPGSYTSLNMWLFACIQSDTTHEIFRKPEVRRLCKFVERQHILTVTGTDNAHPIKMEVISYRY